MIKYRKEPIELKYIVPNGNYEVCLSVTAEADTVYNVYSQNRRFAAEDIRIKAGETQAITFIVNVCDYIRRDAVHKEDGMKIDIVCDDAISAMVQQSDLCRYHERSCNQRLCCKNS